MLDVFVSYSARDEELARFVRDELIRHGVSVFAACADLRPGESWSSTIRTNLASVNWVVVLASRAAAGSAYVNQEIGSALASGKRIVPVVWDMEPSELPGWLKAFQAVDLRNKTVEGLQGEVRTLAARVHEGNRRVALVLGVIVLGLVLVAARD